MLVAEGRLVPADGGYAPTGDLTNLAVPETLHALIAARLDALAADRTRARPGCGRARAELHRRRPGGGRRPRAARRSRSSAGRSSVASCWSTTSTRGRAERGQYAFVQALIREVAYGTLARRDRAGRHLAAARFFESLGEDELAGALAAHYLSAYRAAPDDPDSRPLATQARIALRAAAARAARARQPRPGDDVPASRRWRSRRTRPRSPSCSSGRGRPPILGGRVEQAEPLLRDAIRRREAPRRPVGGGAGDGAAGPGLRECLALKGRDRDPRAGRRRVSATSSTIRRSPRSSTSSRGRTGSGIGTRRRSTSPTGQSGGRSVSRRSELIADALITKGSLLGVRFAPIRRGRRARGRDPARRGQRSQRRSSCAACSTSACRTSAGTPECRSIAAARRSTSPRGSAAEQLCHGPRQRR